MSDIDIKRISYLAKLKLPSEKEEFYSNSLKDIIKWVDNLKKVDTSKTEPLHNVTEKTVSTVSYTHLTLPTKA